MVDDSEGLKTYSIVEWFLYGSVLGFKICFC